MRKLLVKNFVGYTLSNETVTEVIAKLLLLPMTIAVSILAFNMLFCSITAGLTILLYFLPGKKIAWERLRASRILYPTFFISAVIIAKTTMINQSFQWYHYIIFLIMLIMIWIGFSGAKIFYFDLFPLNINELDPEQLKDYNAGKKILNLKIQGDTSINN